MWVCLQNCHLSQSWMPALDRIVDNIDPEKVVTQTPDCPPSKFVRLYLEQDVIWNEWLTFGILATSTLNSIQKMIESSNPHLTPLPLNIYSELEM